MSVSAIHNAPLNRINELPLWRLLLIVMPPLIAIPLASPFTPWVMAVNLFCLAVSVSATPFRYRFPLAIALPIILGLLCMLGFALPSHELLPWRSELLEDFQIDTGNRQSAQFWVSLEHWIRWLYLGAWLSALFVSGFTDREKRLLLQISLLALTTLIAFAAVLKLQGQQQFILWFHPNGSSYQYGPFANRNHFSALCAVTSLLSLVVSYDSFRRHRWHWSLFSACLVIAFLAMMLNTSRFGVIMFFLGSGIWMVTAALRSKSIIKMAVFCSIFLFSATLLILFGQNILQRFSGDGSVMQSVISDGRFHIYGQVLNLLPELPFWGWGLGNFDAIYNLTREDGDLLYRISHPENDFLWHLVETGWLAGFFWLIPILPLVYYFGPWRSRRKATGLRDRRIRQGVSIAVMMALLHSFVDVPLHNFSYALFIVLLIALGINTQHLTLSTSPISKFFKWGIVVLFLLGSASSYSAHRQSPWFPSLSVAQQATQYSLHQNALGNRKAALDSIETSIDIQPLNWEAYFIRAQILLKHSQDEAAAQLDFARARRLQPHSVVVPTVEAQIWEHHNPLLAISAYQEAIRRAPDRATLYFSRIQHLTYLNPNLKPAARAIAIKHPQLYLIYLDLVGPEDFDNELQNLLRLYPLAESYNAIDRLKLLQTWYAKGNRTQLLDRLTQISQWTDMGWWVLATHYGDHHQYQEAVNVTIQYLPVPYSTPIRSFNDLEQLKHQFQINPTDIARGLQLFEALKQDRQYSQALEVLKDLSVIENAPHKITYEQAVMLQRIGDYQKSWEKLVAYIQAIGVQNIHKN